MFNVTKEWSWRIVRLSTICFMFVVVLHAHAYVNRGFVGCWWLQELLSQGFARCAVPFFFVIFGMFLFRDYTSLDGSWWIRKVKARVRSLVVPYVCWTMIGVGSAVLLALMFGKSLDQFHFASLKWWMGVAGIKAGFPIINYHLWFVRNILLFVLISPLLGFVLFKIPRMVLLVLWFVATFGSLRIANLASQLLFVGMGASLAFGVAKINNLEKWTLIALPIWICLVVGKVALYWLGICDVCGTLSIDHVTVRLMPTINVVGVLALWGMGGRLRFDMLSTIHGFSFFAYCFHLSVLTWCTEFVRLVISPETTINCLLIYVLPFVMTIVVVYGLAIALKFYWPKVYSVLSGGR